MSEELPARQTAPGALASTPRPPAAPSGLPGTPPSTPPAQASWVLRRLAHRARLLCLPGHPGSGTAPALGRPRLGRNPQHLAQCPTEEGARLQSTEGPKLLTLQPGPGSGAEGCPDGLPGGQGQLMVELRCQVGFRSQSSGLGRRARMRDWARPVWECLASSEGRTSAGSVPLRPGPPYLGPGGPSPVPSGPQPRIHQKSALCSLTARQAACSTAPPPGLGQRCTTRTHSQILPLRLYSPGPSGALHNPTRGTAASTPELGFLPSPGVGVGGVRL